MHMAKGTLPGLEQGEDAYVSILGENGNGVV